MPLKLLTKREYFAIISAFLRNRRFSDVDLLLQTRRAMYVVEIKRKGEIGESVVEEVAAKVDALRKRKGMSVRAVLVYAGRLSKRVPADGYFSSLVPVEAFFK